MYTAFAYGYTLVLYYVYLQFSFGEGLSSLGTSLSKTQIWKGTERDTLDLSETLDPL